MVDLNACAEQAHALDNRSEMWAAQKTVREQVYQKGLGKGSCLPGVGRWVRTEKGGKVQPSKYQGGGKI